MPPKLSIGTAQFGLSYGITNTEGQVRRKEVKNILLLAHQSSIAYLDTAQSYGNSEEVLGASLPPGSNFHITSKLVSQQDKLFYTKESRSIWEELFLNTCRSLNSNKISTFLLHSSSDLRKNGSHFLVDWLLSLKKRGLVDRLGVSIYEAGDLNAIDPRILDVVQLPLSLYDQRLLLDGTVEKLCSNSTAVQARSVYLQGLLLSSPSDWPGWVPSSLIKHHESLVNLSIDKKCSLLDLALGFVRDQTELEAAVLGICNVNQLKQLVQSFSSPSPWKKNEWRSWSLNDQVFVDPRLWPR